MGTSYRAVPSADNGSSYDGHYMDAGKAAESIVLSWLENNPGIIGVEDLRSLRQMREADVDVSLRLYDGRVALAEIKSDYHLGVSGNVIFEILRINHTCNSDYSCVLGWSARSPATWLLFYSPQTNSIYQIYFSEYRKGMQTFTKEKDFKSLLKVVRTDRIKTTINILIPQSYFKNMKIYSLQ